MSPKHALHWSLSQHILLLLLILLLTASMLSTFPASHIPSFTLPRNRSTPKINLNNF